jgi:hypothetical protein
LPYSFSPREDGGQQDQLGETVGFELMSVLGLAVIATGVGVAAATGEAGNTTGCGYCCDVCCDFCDGCIEGVFT